MSSLWFLCILYNFTPIWSALLFAHNCSYFLFVSKGEQQINWQRHGSNLKLKHKNRSIIRNSAKKNRKGFDFKVILVCFLGSYIIQMCICLLCYINLSHVMKILYISMNRRKWKKKTRLEMKFGKEIIYNVKIFHRDRKRKRCRQTEMKCMGIKSGKKHKENSWYLKIEKSTWQCWDLCFFFFYFLYSFSVYLSQNQITSSLNNMKNKAFYLISWHEHDVRGNRKNNSRNLHSNANILHKK